MFNSACSLRPLAGVRAKMLALVILAGFLFAVTMWRNRSVAAQSLADSPEPMSILPAAAGDVDPSFNASVFEPGGNFGGGVARQSDGKLIVYGDLGSINGTARDGIARLNADGSLDPSFDPHPQSGSIGQIVMQTVAVQTDGKIVIDGSFTSVNGTARNRIVRPHVDGSLDTSFNPGSGAEQLVELVPVQQNGQ